MAQCDQLKIFIVWKCSYLSSLKFGVPSCCLFFFLCFVFQPVRKSLPCNFCCNSYALWGNWVLVSKSGLRKSRVEFFPCVSFFGVSFFVSRLPIGNFSYVCCLICLVSATSRQKRQFFQTISWHNLSALDIKELDTITSMSGVFTDSRSLVAPQFRPKFYRCIIVL